MNRKSLIVLVVSIVALLAIVLSGCGKAIVSTISLAGTGTTETSQTSAKEKSYACLSPIGIQPPVQISPLATRLDTLDGKVIYVNQGEADPIIMPALWERVQKDFPKYNLEIHTDQQFWSLQHLKTKLRQTANAVLRGIAW